MPFIAPAPVSTPVSPLAFGDPFRVPPRAMFRRDVVAAEYALRCTHTQRAAEVIRDNAGRTDCYWSADDQCWRVQVWAVRPVAAALRSAGFTVEGDQP